MLHLLAKLRKEEPFQGYCQLGYNGTLNVCANPRVTCNIALTGCVKTELM